MPLVRYEIRNEHSLANPQLYRTAAKDDPEGLLEGVAMAGLVGIVRQLGDLAEFAAEVFRDLHEEVMATASRGHELLARVQQLEAEMPAVEKALLSETNQLRFAYTPGAEWHASIRNDQNHCTQGDLPRFIRSSYEECRGPPRLFLLDKFDVAGAGACLKRYTDPSFFRTEWASSELMKAERVQRDKKARREKKKGRRRRNVDGKESIPVDQFHTRFSHELSKEFTKSDQVHSRMWHQPATERPEDASSAQGNVNYNENLIALSRHLSEAQGGSRNATKMGNVSPGHTREGPASNFVDESVPTVTEVLASPPDVTVPNVSETLTLSPSKPLRTVSAISIDEEMLKKWEETGPCAADKDESSLQTQEGTVSSVVDDGASEGEQFLDALTTIESEADSDSEPRFRQDRDADGDMVSDSNEGQSLLHEGISTPGIDQMSADEKVTPEPVEQRLESASLDYSQKEILQDLSVIVNGQDVKGTGSLKTTVHVRRHSAESVSSSTAPKAKHFQALEEPLEGLKSRPKPLIPAKDKRGARNSFDLGAISSFNGGVKVSKMVAAFERGSLEQIHADESEKEPQVMEGVSTTVESVAESENHMAEEMENVGVHEGQSTGKDSLEGAFSTSPGRAASNSTKVLSPKLRTSPALRIRLEGTSISSQLSTESFDSPPDSPTFSALHSPLSPITIERNILLSPDSRRLHFSEELLSPGSPTTVPILAHSPTLRARPPDFSSQDWGHHHTITIQSVTVDEPLSLTSPSRSPVELPLTSQTEHLFEAASLSSGNTKIVHDNASPVLTQVDDSDVCYVASSARSSENFPSFIQPLRPSEFVSPRAGRVDIVEKLENIAAHDVLHASTADPDLSTSLKTQDVENIQSPILSPSQAIGDDMARTSTLEGKSPDHAPSKIKEGLPVEPIVHSWLPHPSASVDSRPHVLSTGNQDQSHLSPHATTLVHDLNPPIYTRGTHDKLHVSSVSTRPNQISSQVSHSKPTTELQFQTKVVSHKRFPSLPLSEKTAQDFDSVLSLKSLQDPTASALASKVASEDRLAISKFARSLPSASPPSRTIHDAPYSIIKAAHNRFPSFPSSDKTTLEFPSESPLRALEDPPVASFIPSERSPVVEVSASKRAHGQPSPSSPSQTLHDLPAPVPPSKSNRDFPAAPPPPFQTPLELPPPPPPSRNAPSLTISKPSTVTDGQDGLLEAITTHDKSKLKKVKTMQNPILRRGDDRTHLLEQIRAQSFNLRHTVVEKIDHPLPRPVTNINVAAILEKANAIRQAFAGSDEDDEDDDEWSDV